MPDRQHTDFYEIQRRQWRRTVPLTFLLFLFYTAVFGLLGLIIAFAAGIFRGEVRFLSGPAAGRALIAAVVLALGLAVFHYFDARKNGARFIIRRLDGRPPERGDRYHLQFADTIEEIRIAAGLPRVRCYVLPTLAINCLALIEADGTPAVAMTEGLLSEATRDELQAAAAHELAHITRGDTVFITLVCSLAGLFERWAESLQPDEEPPAEFAVASSSARGTSFLLDTAAGFSALIMRLLSTLISRQREILADAAAVELCRAPEALARILYKAKLKNAFVGDFRLTYSPLFIVSSDPLSENEGLRGTLFSTHPPLMDRIERLARMAHKTGGDIIEQVWDIQKNRRDNRRTLKSEEEYRRVSQPPSSSGAPPAPPDKPWLIPDDKGRWIGPLSLEELLRNPYFLMASRVKNVFEGIEAAAGDFPAIRDALRRDKQKKRAPELARDRCPRCRLPLGDYFYEGVSVKICRKCLGKLVDARAMDRILARREFNFSPELIRKAEEFKRRFLTNPLHAQRLKDRESPPLFCPACGFRMASRPYNYQYFLPVVKCLSCSKIWFDADELEILQALVEKPGD